MAQVGTQRIYQARIETEEHLGEVPGKDIKRSPGSGVFLERRIPITLLIHALRNLSTAYGSSG